MGPHLQLLLPSAPGRGGPPVPGATHLAAVELSELPAVVLVQRRRGEGTVGAVPAAGFRERLCGAAEAGGGTPTHSCVVLKGLECLSPDTSLDSVSMVVGRPLQNCYRWHHFLTAFCVCSLTAF